MVGEASDGVEAVNQPIATAPDVILMDVRMPRLDRLASTPEPAAELRGLTERCD